MTIEKIQKYLDDSLRWTFTDLFYAYCEENGCDDPECDLTDEEYEKMENDCINSINYTELSRLIDNILKDADKRIHNMFS